MEEKIEITYKKPIFYRLVLASVIDFIIFILVFFALFLAMRAIVTNNGAYKEMNTKADKYRVDSGLYVKVNDQVKDLITYLNEDNILSYGAKNSTCDKEVLFFADYLGDLCGAQSKNKVLTNYDEFRLDSKLVFDGQTYFIKEDGNVVKNPNCTATLDKYYDNVYTPYIDTNCNGYLLSEVKEYYNINKTLSYLVIFLEIPVSVFISSILIFCVPSFCFRRERYTVGKFLYRIGQVGPNYLHVSWKRLLARCVVFELAIILLSLVTFGIPILITFTMMVVTKYNQSFPNMMVGIYEVDVSHDKIYYSLKEIEYEVVDTHKKPIDFKLPEN